MKKPRPGKNTLPDFKKVMKKPEKEERKLYPVYADGQFNYYDQETGELVERKEVTSFTLEKFNEEKFDVFLDAISTGLGLRQSLKDAGIKYASYLLWRKNIPDLKTRISEARSIRSEAVVEEMYTGELSPLMQENVYKKDLTDLALYDRRVKTLRGKQAMFKAFRAMEGISINELNQTSQLNVNTAIKIEVPTKAVELIEQNFRPSLHGEKMRLPSPSPVVVEFEDDLRKQGETLNETANSRRPQNDS